MWVHPQFDPIAIKLGPLAVHWYGLTYLAAFGMFLWLANRRVARPDFAKAGWSSRDVDDLLFFGVLGVVLGGRLGYALFYKPDYYLHHLGEVLAVWKGGMSFHGGLLGVLVAMALFAKLRGRTFFEVTDLIAPCVPTGLAAGRVGNFINGELWGRVADSSLPWAMVFPQSPTLEPRHPSQIYQFIGEGLFLFTLLWLYGRKARLTGQVSGLFLIGYGAQRFVTEFFRQPDDFLGLRALNLSQGQWLSLPMVVAGIAIWLWASRRKA
ncbi:prolipoprotein diacylglyceryl transferase [Paucibacter sp. Y2R2-4]|uniref:prolipoprotein diacylglyceryl transferase n=1 Tax=Paucibacter sp. Y2R2-4 TaxID=2893553 RepID=UPI0021E38AEF|nr:prolipoprotein diacylglyceryl transferase [Paucibacter sp. Y2R2-4]MCV2348665.1 prolipoprotein diacylglyceryl transferase [Paucibacter sp. Y2R2-4]